MPPELSKWADRHGVLRNLPAFALLYWVLLLVAGLRRRWQVLASVCVLAAGFEFVQIALPQRSFGWDDIYTSCAGAIAAHLVVLLGMRIWKGKAEARDAPV